MLGDHPHLRTPQATAKIKAHCLKNIYLFRKTFGRKFTPKKINGGYLWVLGLQVSFISLCLCVCVVFIYNENVLFGSSRGKPLLFVIQNKPSKYIPKPVFCGDPQPARGSREPRSVRAWQKNLGPEPWSWLRLLLCDLGPLTALLWASVPFIWNWVGGGSSSRPSPPPGGWETLRGALRGGEACLAPC